MRTLQRRTAFTLVELLVVVGIVAVLAVVAILYFSEAQARAKLSRARADIRTVAHALEAYRAEENAYPPAAIGDILLHQPLAALTTPVAFISSVPPDGFGAATFDFAPTISMLGYNYKDAASTSINMPGETYGRIWRELPGAKYMLHSCGPNLRWDVTPYIEYDPTNGTRSSGDISVFGPLPSPTEQR